MFKDKELAKEAVMNSKDLTDEEKSAFIKAMSQEGFDNFGMMMDSVFMYGRITCLENLIDTFHERHKDNLDESVTCRNMIGTFKALKAFEENKLEESEQ